MHPLHPRTSETYNTGSKTNHSDSKAYHSGSQTYNHGGKTTALQKEHEASDGPLPETFVK